MAHTYAHVNDDDRIDEIVTDAQTHFQCARSTFALASSFILSQLLTEILLNLLMLLVFPVCEINAGNSTCMG